MQMISSRKTSLEEEESSCHYAMENVTLLIVTKNRDSPAGCITSLASAFEIKPLWFNTLFYGAAREQYREEPMDPLFVLGLP